MNVQKYNKAIVAAVVAAIFAALHEFGVSDHATLAEVIPVVIAAVVSGAGVYAVPNQK